MLDALRQNRLAQLPAHRFVAREEADACELLRDCARPFRSPPLAQVRQDGTHDTYPIDAVVVVEARILDCHDGVAQMARHAIERNLYPVLRRYGKQRAIGRIVQNGAFNGFPKLSQLFFAGKSGHYLIQKPARENDNDATDGGQRPNGVLSVWGEVVPRGVQTVPPEPPGSEFGQAGLLFDHRIDRSNGRTTSLIPARSGFKTAQCASRRRWPQGFSPVDRAAGGQD